MKTMLFVAVFTSLVVVDCTISARLITVKFELPMSMYKRWFNNGALPVIVATTFESKVDAVKRGGMVVAGATNPEYDRAKGRIFSTGLLTNQKNLFLITMLKAEPGEIHKITVSRDVESTLLKDGKQIIVPFARLEKK